MAPTWTDATAPFASRPLSSTLSGEVTSSQCPGAGVEPLLRLRRHHGGQPGEVAGDKAHRVHRVAGGDGQRVGAEFGVALPGAVRRPRQDALAQQADMDRQHLADKAGLDQFLHVHHRRIDAGLQADRGDETLGLGQRRQFHGLRCRPPERPFAIDVLARLQRRLGRRVVRRHAHDDRDRVDLRRGDHLAVVVKGEPRAVGLARRLGAVGLGGADRRQFDIRAGLHRRQVGARRPGALTLAPIRPSRILSAIASSRSLSPSATRQARRADGRCRARASPHRRSRRGTRLAR